MKLLYFNLSFYLSIILIVLFLLLIRERIIKKKFYANFNVDFLSFSNTKISFIKNTLAIIVAFLLCFLLLRPVVFLQDIKNNETLYMLDVSKSMDLMDSLDKSRLEISKEIINSLVDTIPTKQALACFTSNQDIVVPAGLDKEHLKSVCNSLSSSLIDKGGTSLNDLMLYLKSFKNYDDIIIISDGGDDAVDLNFDFFVENKINVHFIFCGTSKGSLIKNTNFISKRNDKLLDKLKDKENVFVYTTKNYQSLISKLNNKKKEDSSSFEDSYQMALLIAFFLLLFIIILQERKTLNLNIAIVCLICCSFNSNEKLDEMFSNKDYQLLLKQETKNEDNDFSKSKILAYKAIALFKQKEKHTLQEKKLYVKYIKQALSLNPTSKTLQNWYQFFYYKLEKHLEKKKNSTPNNNDASSDNNQHNSSSSAGNAKDKINYDYSSLSKEGLLNQARKNEALLREILNNKNEEINDW